MNTSELRLEIAVELGTVQVSLEQLLNLTPGALIEFNPPENMQLRLRVGEETLGTGLLRTRDGHYYIQIAEVDEKIADQTLTGKIQR